jgi:hypothetical protein
MFDERSGLKTKLSPSWGWLELALLGVVWATLTVILLDSTTGTRVAAPELPATSNTEDEGGWHFFKCAPVLTPTGTDSYLIRATLSSTVSLSTNGAALQPETTCIALPIRSIQ